MQAVVCFRKLCYLLSLRDFPNKTIDSHGLMLTHLMLDRELRINLFTNKKVNILETALGNFDEGKFWWSEISKK